MHGADRRRTQRDARGLGEDSAVRETAEGRIYDVLGFELLATRAGSDAVRRDPTNPGAHLFLADIYRSRPGFQVAQASELLVAELYSKPSKNALQPSRTEADLGLLDTTGAARVSFHEFSPLFDGDGAHLVASAGIGTTAFFEDEVSLSLLQGNYSLNVSQFHSQSTGFRPNDDVRHEIVSIVGKAQVTPDLTLTAEGRFRQTDEGDRFLRSFEEETTLRTQELSNRFLFSLGGHAELSSSNDVLFRAAIAQDRLDRETSFVDPFFGIPLLFEDETITQSYNFELQDTHRFDWGHVIVGGFLGLTELEFDFGVGPLFYFLQETTQFTAYGYGFLNPVDWAEITLGVSVDRADFLEASSGFDPFFNDIRVTVNRDFLQVNPKVGLRVTPFDGLVLRGAYARTLSRENIQDQTLEPTTIAGFNQFFDDFARTDTELIGAGFDLQILDNLWLVGEYTRRELDTPIFDFDLTTFNTTVPIFLDGDERSFRGELNATFGDRWSGSIGVQFTNNETEFLDRPDDVETFTAPVRVTYFDPTGLFATAEATYFTQNSVGQAFLDDGLLSIDTDEEGLVLNASVGFRFPNERGVASIELNNILDQSFALQNSLVNSVRPINRSLAEGFTAIGRLTLSF